MGGSTVFLNEDCTDRREVAPRRGTALIWQQDLTQADWPVVVGKKCVMHFDIMFAMGQQGATVAA